MCRTAEIRKAAEKAIYDYGRVTYAANRLGIAAAHLYNVFERDNPSPTLEEALIKHNYLAPRPTRTRLAIDCERSARRRFRDAAAAQGMTGEQYLLYLMERAK